MADKDGEAIGLLLPNHAFLVRTKVHARATGLGILCMLVVYLGVVLDLVSRE